MFVIYYVSIINIFQTQQIYEQKTLKTIIGNKSYYYNNNNHEHNHNIKYNNEQNDKNNNLNIKTNN